MFLKDFEQTLMKRLGHIRTSNTEPFPYLDILMLFNQTFDASWKFSADMPEGFESADGMTDPDLKTIFLNKAYLSSTLQAEGLFFFLHELRHAMQYTKPELFSEAVQRNLTHVLQYEGTCFVLCNGEWMEGHMDGDTAYFTELYLASPTEVDANEFAFHCLTLLGLEKQVEELCTQRCPVYSCFPKSEADAEFMKMADKMDALLKCGERQMQE